MAVHKAQTFWDIEKEKTWRIYFLYTFLVLFYFTSVFFLWLIIKFLIYMRISVQTRGASFNIFGYDTLIVLVIAGIVATVHWYYSNITVVRKILQLLGAQYPDKRDKYHHVFQNVVDEIEISAGGLQVERYILPTGAMNAFALADLKGRKVVGITEGLLSRLTRHELQSVVAHEMAHIVSNDCLQSTIACSLFGIYGEALAHLNLAFKKAESSFPSHDKTAHQNAAAFGMLYFPALVTLLVTDILSDLLHMFISREKEYRADASAIKYTRNPLNLASALYKIGTHWRGTGLAGDRLAPIFILNPKFSSLDEKEGFLPTLFSTHPPFIKRLQIILDLAHADLNQVAEELQKKSGVKTEAEQKKPKPAFLAEHHNKWFGPFTLLQLQTIDWLTPETKLRMNGRDEVLIAGEVPALQYYFQKCSEPMWKIRRLCPVCREWLIPQAYEGLYVWRCAFCNGILARQDKLPRIFVRKEKGFTERIQRIATFMRQDTKKKHPRFRLLLDMSHPRHCPRCGKGMSHKFYSYAYHVEIDECQSCGLIWFDAEELEILQCLIEMGEAD